MSDIAKARRKGRITRHRRVRKKISGTAARPRLAVHRSNRHITAQVIDDETGRTIAAASSVEPALRSDKTGSVDAAAKIGALVAERARAEGVTSVVFDRGGNLYHGRIAAVATAAREAGLEF
ncbi:MAG: 50S ribosomal protein L18 [Ilumatobacteraceae bacterium]|jgi:large subunit ribosomal protein L18|nr:50S ribosomal protein L18 [Ilumatobacteraceae bacterium]